MNYASNKEDNMEQIIAILAGMVGVPLVTVLKKALGWKDEAAMLLTFGVSVALGILSLFISGTITGTSFQPGQLWTTIGLSLSAATLVFKLLVKPQEDANSTSTTTK
jgi:hypothetical protein